MTIVDGIKLGIGILIVHLTLAVVAVGGVVLVGYLSGGNTQTEEPSTADGEAK